MQAGNRGLIEKHEGVNFFLQVSQLGDLFLDDNGEAFIGLVVLNLEAFLEIFE